MLAAALWLAGTPGAGRLTSRSVARPALVRRVPSSCPLVLAALSRGADDLAPDLSMAVPIRTPPEPLVVGLTFAGAKYSARPIFCSFVVMLISHISRKNAIMAVTKSA